MRSSTTIRQWGKVKYVFSFPLRYSLVPYESVLVFKQEPMIQKGNVLEMVGINVDIIESTFTGGPRAISYFVKALRKCTWFSVAPCVLSNTGAGSFGREFDCTLNRSNIGLSRDESLWLVRLLFVIWQHCQIAGNPLEART